MTEALVSNLHTAGISSTRLGIYIYAGISGLGTLVGLWGVFSKAGWRGWEAIIPVWSTYGACRIARGSGWFLILLLIPFINLIAWLVVLWDLARSFALSRAWFFGLWLLPFVFFPLLGFGKAAYLGPAGDPRARDAFGNITREG